MAPSPRDRDTLRRLAESYAEIAALPVHREKAELWRRVNDLDPVRPVVYIKEHPVHELGADDELAAVCEDPEARALEQRLRLTLHLWRTLPCDTVLSPWLACPTVFHDSHLGLSIDERTLSSDAANAVVAHEYLPVLRDFSDLDRIKDPVVTVDREATAARRAWMEATFGDLLPVRPEGVRMVWYTIWDTLVQLLGVENALVDLCERPDFIHACVERLHRAFMVKLDRYEALGLLSPNAGNFLSCSGGYGYAAGLPADEPATGAAPESMWGYANAQIFTSVSPEMHWEFAIRHELPWMERWGLNYYGCCEALESKIDLMRRIPRLRKVSVSPMSDPLRMAEVMDKTFVYSYKPNPAWFAGDDWRPDAAEAELRRVLSATRGRPVEIILKDLSTIRYQPRRLKEWHDRAMRLVERGD